MYMIAFSDIYVSVFLFKPTGGVWRLDQFENKFHSRFLLCNWLHVHLCVCVCVAECECVYVSGYTHTHVHVHIFS